jgi:hypothetical protein
MLGIETLISQSISFEPKKKAEGFQKDRLLLTTQNIEIFKIENIKENSNSKLSIEDEKKEKLINEQEKALIILLKLFALNKQKTFFNLLRCIKLKIFQNSAKMITKNLKIYFEKLKKSTKLKPEDLKLNEEICKNLLQNSNLILKPQQKINLTLEDISAYNNHLADESSTNNIDNSGYSETVIDLVHVIQLYIYDKANPINKYNYLLRIFNKWRNICNKSQQENKISPTPIKKRIESFPDISPIISENTPKIDKDRIKKSKSNDTSNFERENLIVCIGETNTQKKKNSINLYSNYINNLSRKIEKFFEKIQTFCIKGIINHILKSEITKKVTFAEESEDNLGDSTTKLTESKKISNSKSHKKQYSSEKNITKLEIFSFDINLSSSVNCNYRPSTLRNPSYSFAEEDRHTLNIQINRKSNKSDISKNIRKNTNYNNESFSQNPYYNSGNNQSVGFSKNMSFNSELRLDEEPDEINEIRISCAIEIQNFWREYKIHKYLLNYSSKLKILDRFIKRKNLKSKNFVFLCYAQWKKKLFMSKMNKTIQMIQKFYRQKIKGLLISK